MSNFEIMMTVWGIASIGFLLGAAWVAICRSGDNRDGS
jgi:hypothetical protein